MMDALSAGELLARRYRLIDRIGAGGMSLVWRARDEVLDRIVAVKVLAPELSADPQLRRLVRDEARATARLVHPHVAAVHDYGETYGPEGEPTAFVVLELMTGESLTARLRAGRLPWPEAVRICGQVAEALAAAHRIGIVHRDVTPDNVMLTAVGAKVFDFGIATRVGAPDEDEDGATFGTPTYVAPERLDGVPAQPATDVYALGVILYEMLTGQPPFRADTWEELALVPRHADPPAPAGVPGLPVEVAGLCRRCLGRDPAARPTAKELADALAPYAGPPVPARRRPWRVVLTGAAAALVLVAAGTVGWLMSPDPPRGTRPPGAAPATSASTTPVPSGAPPSVTVPPRRTTSPPARADINAVIAGIRTVIDSGQTSGDIRPDAAVDLRQLLENLRIAVARGGGDVPDRVSGLRAKVTARVGEGAISQPVAVKLDRELTRLAILTT